MRGFSFLSFLLPLSLLLASCSTDNSAVVLGTDYGALSGQVGSINHQELNLIPENKRVPVGEICGSTIFDKDFCIPQDQVVIINFWGSWCPPCVKEMPDLQFIADNSSVPVIGVNSQDSKTNAQIFVDDYGLTFENLFDGTGEVASKFGASAPTVMPTTLVLDSQNRVALRIDGATTKERLSSVIEGLGVLGGTDN